MYHERPWLKHYDPTIPPELDLPEITLVDNFNDIRSRFPNKPALRFLGLTITYEQLNTYADSFAHALINNGCMPGNTVGINLPNVPQYLIALIGSLKAGCAISGVSPLLTAGEMEHQLVDSQVTALVTADPIFEHRFVGIADRIPDLKLIISTGILDFLPWIKRTLAKVLKKVPQGKVTPLPGKTVLKLIDILSDYPAKDPHIDIKPDDHCLIQYTGGTTGLPKGTILTQRHIVSELTIVTTWLQMVPGKEVILSGFPFFHIAGLALGLGSLFQGHTQILVPDPRNTKLIISEMGKYRPTILVNVPSLYMMLVEKPDFRKLDHSRLGFCLSAASPFPAESIRELESIIGENKLIECFGMTEVCALCTMNPRLGTKKIGSVGLPICNNRLRLMDLETGTNDVPVGEEGEIVVSAPHVMKGYLNKPSETENTLREHDGEIWLHTGDVARMDEDGYFYIVDRTKDMLNVGGYKVFSREVEEKLYEHPAIEFCAVIGIPNTKRPGTDIVKLIVQLNPEYASVQTDGLKNEILEYARANMAPYKVPKILEITEEIPLTAVGKVDKKVLRQRETT